MPPFLASYAAKYGAMLIIFVTAVVGAYSVGNSRGYAKGYDVGHKEAWNTQQTTINQMIDQQNAEHQATNKRIADLERQSHLDAATIQDLTERVTAQRQTVITKYVTQNKQSAASCGFDTSMADAINQLLDASPVFGPQAPPLNQGTANGNGPGPH